MNALEPINSPANDMYYFKHDDTTYMASNRLGGYYSKNPTCCSDIYMDYPEIEVVTETTEDTIEITEISNENSYRSPYTLEMTSPTPRL